MTHARYTSETNELIELPGMPEPIWKHWHDSWKEYNAHLATLRRIPCSDDCKGHWRDGQEVTEGKDYEVNYVEADIYSNPGTKVKALFKDGKICHGSDFDQEKAMSYLKPDVVYELNCTDVGSWHTDFYLNEFPKVAFNSVHFVYPEPVAVPLTPKSEDDLWQEVIHIYWKRKNEGVVGSQIIRDLAKQFSITRKQ